MKLLQGVLPLNPQGFGGVRWDLAFNTAASFVSNTNWQAYSGEESLFDFTQMTALTVQNFLSAAIGVAVLFAMIRGFILKKRLSGISGMTLPELSCIFLYHYPYYWLLFWFPRESYNLSIPLKRSLHFRMD